MNKKILILCIIVVLSTAGVLFGLNIRNERIIKHEQQLLIVSEQIVANTYLSLVLIDGLSNAWNTGIDGGLESTEMAFDLYKKLADFGSVLEDSTAKIEAELQSLKNSPYKKDERFAGLLEMFGIYNQLKSLAFTPAGSLLSYNLKINDLSSEYTKALSKLKIHIPELKENNQLKKTYENQINELGNKFVREYKANVNKKVTEAKKYLEDLPPAEEFDVEKEFWGR